MRISLVRTALNWVYPEIKTGQDVESKHGNPHNFVKWSAPIFINQERLDGMVFDYEPHPPALLAVRLLDLAGAYFKLCEALLTTWIAA